MLQPKRAKYRRQMRGSIPAKTTRGTKVSFGEYGLKVVEAGYLSARQLEAARRSVTHYTKRGGKLWIRVFPDRPIVKKPAETRMGGGKSPVDHYAAAVPAGRVVLELAGVPEETAREALKRAAQKLSLKTKIVKQL